jgi:two-component system, OmpR family, Ni(II)-sensor and/or redox sensor kinase NrsS
LFRITNNEFDLKAQFVKSQNLLCTSNLIANAIHYTPAYGKVAIELEQLDRSALITIKDTGIGIPAAEQTRIFERFYRIESDRSAYFAQR